MSKPKKPRPYSTEADRAIRAFDEFLDALGKISTKRDRDSFQRFLVDVALHANDDYYEGWNMRPYNLNDLDIACGVYTSLTCGGDLYEDCRKASRESDEAIC